MFLLSICHGDMIADFRDTYLAMVILLCSVRHAYPIMLSENGKSLHSPLVPNLHLQFSPTTMEWIYTNTIKDVQINCSNQMPNNTMPHSMPVTQMHTYIAKIWSADPVIAEVLPHAKHRRRRYDNQTDLVLMELRPAVPSSVSVGGGVVGYATIQVEVYASPINFSQFLEYEDLTQFDEWSMVAHEEFRVTVGRRTRMFDVIFNIVLATVATLNSFSMGCSTDWHSLRENLKHPANMIIGLSCQYLLLPPVALIIVFSLGLHAPDCLGLVYVACVPGGGLGHIIVQVVDGDSSLSLSMNCIGTFLALGTAPVWLLSLPWLVDAHHPILALVLHFELWLAGLAIAYILGGVLNHVWPGVSGAILNWLVKPGILLFFIATPIGVYINIYVFQLPDMNLALAAGLLPFSGFLAATVAVTCTRCEEPVARCITAETTIVNTFAALVMSRFMLPQPQSDLTSALIFWTLVLTPLPFLLTFIIRRCRQKIRERCEKRKEDKYRNFSIVSSLMNVTNVTSLSGSIITPKMNSPTTEDGIDDNSKLMECVDEKVTVL